jgi:hypothetical protein
MSQSTQQRERQLGSVQKELLTNYFLQKYNNLMAQMALGPEQPTPTFQPPRPPFRGNRKINFKDLLKERNRSNSQRHTKQASHSHSRSVSPKKEKSPSPQDSRKSTDRNRTE